MLHSQSYLKSSLIFPALTKLGFLTLVQVNHFYIFNFRTLKSSLLTKCNRRIDDVFFFTVGPQAMFAMSQANLLANKRRKFMLSGYVSKESNQSVNFHWAPFPIEMTGASAFVPSPSGLKLLVIRNPENESPMKFEIWSSSQLEKEFHIPQKVHGSVYVDGWCRTFFG